MVHGGKNTTTKNLAQGPIVYDKVGAYIDEWAMALVAVAAAVYDTPRLGRILILSPWPEIQGDRRQPWGSVLFFSPLGRQKARLPRCRPTTPPPPPTLPPIELPPPPIATGAINSSKLISASFPPFNSSAPCLLMGFSCSYRYERYPDTSS